MGWYQIDAFLHLLAAMLLTGYALFWAVMAASLARAVRPRDLGHHLGLVRTSRWPHVAVPQRWRLRLPVIGWLLITGVALTGVLAGLFAHSVAVGGLGGAMSPLLALKLVLFVVLVTGHALAMRQPKPLLLHGNLALVVAITAISANLMR